MPFSNFDVMNINLIYLIKGNVDNFIKENHHNISSNDENYDGFLEPIIYKAISRFRLSHNTKKILINLSYYDSEEEELRWYETDIFAITKDLSIVVAKLRCNLNPLLYSRLLDYIHNSQFIHTTERALDTITQEFDHMFQCRSKLIHTNANIHYKDDDIVKYSGGKQTVTLEFDYGPFVHDGVSFFQFDSNTSSLLSTRVPPDVPDDLIYLLVYSLYYYSQLKDIELNYATIEFDSKNMVHIKQILDSFYTLNQKYISTKISELEMYQEIWTKIQHFLFIPHTYSKSKENSEEIHKRLSELLNESGNRKVEGLTFVTALTGLLGINLIVNQTSEDLSKLTPNSVKNVIHSFIPNLTLENIDLVTKTANLALAFLAFFVICYIFIRFIIPFFYNGVLSFLSYIRNFYRYVSAIIKNSNRDKKRHYTKEKEKQIS